MLMCQIDIIHRRSAACRWTWTSSSGCCRRYAARAPLQVRQLQEWAQRQTCRAPFWCSCPAGMRSCDSRTALTPACRAQGGAGLHVGGHEAFAHCVARSISPDAPTPRGMICSAGTRSCRCTPWCRQLSSDACLFGRPPAFAKLYWPPTSVGSLDLPSGCSAATHSPDNFLRCGLTSSLLRT